MDKTTIFTHRGIEPSNPKAWPESSFESFENHLARGFGIEFDPNFAKDEIVVIHDSSLTRITSNKDNRKIAETSVSELKYLKYGKENNGRIPTFKEVLSLISKNSVSLNALHLKGIFQNKEKIVLLIKEINKFPEVVDKILFFDIKPEFAEYIKSQNQNFKLAASVAHEFDIKRYNTVANGTLLSVKEAINHKSLYDWVWLDEWDTLGEKNQEKQFYTEETFSELKKTGYKISLVTPELHATSPGLLGGEAHKDAKDKETLFNRIKEILLLNPDAVCTDYPEEVKEMLVSIDIR